MERKENPSDRTTDHSVVRAHATGHCVRASSLMGQAAKDFGEEKAQRGDGIHFC